MDRRKEKPYGACAVPRGHDEHLCRLMERGLMGEIRRRSAQPAFVCGNCGAKGDQAADLCNPKTAREGPSRSLIDGKIDGKGHT